jgi:hypothetical protein
LSDYSLSPRKLPESALRLGEHQGGGGGGRTGSIRHGAVLGILIVGWESSALIV